MIKRKDCEWCAGCGHDYYGDRCEHCVSTLVRYRPVLCVLGMVLAGLSSGAASTDRNVLAVGLLAASLLVLAIVKRTR